MSDEAGQRPPSKGTLPEAIGAEKRGKSGMTKPTISLQELRVKIGQRAKSAPAHRSCGLHVHIMKPETLEAAYLEAKRNGGAPGPTTRRSR